MTNIVLLWRRLEGQDSPEKLTPSLAREARQGREPYESIKNLIFCQTPFTNFSDGRNWLPRQLGWPNPPTDLRLRFYLNMEWLYRCIVSSDIYTFPSMVLLLCVGSPIVKCSKLSCVMFLLALTEPALYYSHMCGALASCTVRLVSASLSNVWPG